VKDFVKVPKNKSEMKRKVMEREEQTKKIDGWGLERLVEGVKRARRSNLTGV